MARLHVTAAALVLFACTDSPMENSGQPEDFVSFDRALHSTRPDFEGTWSMYQFTEALGDILIYDIQNGFVYDGPASAARVLLNVHDGQIRDAADEVVLCRFGNIPADQLYGTSGDTFELLYVLDRNLVYDAGGRLRFSIKGDQVFRGHWSRGDVLVTATERIERASGEQMLLIAALVGGECGAPDLPER